MYVSVSPHIRWRKTTSRIMWLVVIALLPAFAGSIYFFGLRALYLTLIACASAQFSEWLCLWVRRKKITFDGSAILTGILLAFNIPPKSPWWLPAVGSAFAIIIAKQLFGGLGFNILNPALAGRAFLMASWPLIMTKEWMTPLRPAGSTMSGLPQMQISPKYTQIITSATPLKVLKLHSNIPAIAKNLNSLNTIKALFIGNVGGSLGETSALLLLIGGLFLIFTKIIDWRIPLGYIGTVFGFTGILYLTGVTKATPLFHILSGGLFLGAFFMATDYVTSPVTKKGRWLFAIGCGIITVIIRLWGGYPEGVCYSILLMNCVTPLLDRSTRPRRFGT